MRAILAVLMIAGAAMGAEPATQPSTRPAAKAKARMTTDGVALPQAGERRFNDALPVIGRAIGSLPEEFADRLFAAQKTPDPIKIREVMLLDKSAFYAIEKYGSSITELILDDGRVSGLVLHHKNASRDGFVELAKAAGVDVASGTYSYQPCSILTTASTRYMITAKRTTSTRPPYLRIEVHPVDLYLSKNSGVGSEIAKAMRRGTFARGMTLDECRIVIGWEETKRSTATEGEYFVWEQIEPRFGAEFGGRSGNMLVRRVTALISNGKCVAFEDSAPPTGTDADKGAAKLERR